jgi:hypothetical protein
MRNLTTLKKKIISDNKLSFLFLINKINYKKLKSIAKRPLLPHYTLYKFFLKSLQTNFVKVWHRNFIQLNKKINFLLPGSLIEKRMFYKNIKFITAYDNSLQNSYSWYNTKVTSILNKTAYFNKLNTYPVIGGHTIISTELKDEIQGIFNKNLIKQTSVDINYYIFFNITLLNIVEFYKILALLWFYKLLN